MKQVLLFFLVLFLPIINSYAFLDNNITLLTMQNGLSDNTVTCIYKDSDNFMWFGTGNGLNRYDGKTVRNFSNNSPYMRVLEIKSLSDSYLAVIADGKLNCFNRKTECFIPVYNASDHSPVRLLRLLPHAPTEFWGLSGGRLILYQYHEIRNKENEVIEIQLDILKEKEFFRDNDPEKISVFCEIDSLKRLGLLTNRGRLLLVSSQSLEQSDAINLITASSPLRITSVYTDECSIWMTTIQDGIIRFHLSDRKIERITYEGNSKEKQLSHTDVYQIARIDKEQYIAVTWSGYTILTCDKQTHEISKTTVYKTLPSAYRNVETRMLSVYYDRRGQLWIGTNGGGVIHTDLQAQFYHQFYQGRHNEICGIVIDDERYIWLATYHQGIMKSTTPFDKYHVPEFSSAGPENIRSKSTVLCTLKAPDGTLWFGNYDGTLTSYDSASGKFQVHSIRDGQKIHRAPVWSLYSDSLQQHIWIGTENGLFLYDLSTAKSERLPVEKFLEKEKMTGLFVRAIAGTKSGDIWLGSGNAGIFRLKVTPGGRVSSVHTGYESKAGIDYNSVRSLLASSDGNLYVGYVDGFAVLSPALDSIVDFYTTRDGLSSNYIGAIAEDGKGRIWLGNNSGISRFSRRQNLFYNYYIVGSNRSVLSYEDVLLWGNNRSFTFFNPDALGVSVTDDRVLITGLEVNNKAVSIGESVHGQTILKKGISYTDSLVLSDSNRDFSFTFNNLSYSREQQKYNYRLLPYQKEWLVSDEGEKAVYTNLPEGDYRFEVKSIYPDGQSGKVTVLKIKILPHWSRTVPFRLFVLLCVAGLLAYVFRLIKRRQKRIEQEMQMKHELLSVNLEREKEHQIRIERENFFTNVAHELRTPLMLILSPLQELLQQLRPSDTLYNRLFIMYKNGTSLSTLINHLLYVQKIEAGMVKLHLSETDIVSLTRDIAESFRPIAEVKGFRFDIDLPEAPLLLWMDVEKITMAIRNLLSNAFKYTSAGGKVAIHLSQTIHDEKEFVEIAVSDTGAGIPVELQNRIFDSFITGESHPAFSTKVGVGLRIVKNTMDLHHGQVILHSTPGEGSSFILSIPKGKDHFVGDAYEYIDYRQIKEAYEEELRLDFSEASVPVASPVEESGEQPSSSMKKILIIEDNEEIRLYLRSLFIRKYTVYQAENGEEGVRMASELLPDLIISDVLMPVKDGITCCSEIRNLPKTAHIPILILTAKAEDADILLGCRSGADDYMMKPFNPAILIAKVENLILQRERLKRIYTKALMIKEETIDEGKENPFMQQVINVIELNLSDENFNVKALAKEMNMSQPTLYRRMKQHSELAVVDVIRSVRISKAASLLMENRYSIQEVSGMVGYSDVRTLRKHFTEQFGVSPSKYMDKKDE
ncbi:two-component regulator propeller domain-containing protein [Bacteroides sp.]